MISCGKKSLDFPSRKVVSNTFFMQYQILTRPLLLEKKRENRGPQFLIGNSWCQICWGIQNFGEFRKVIQYILLKPFQWASNKNTNISTVKHLLFTLSGMTSGATTRLVHVRLAFEVKEFTKKKIQFFQFWKLRTADRNLCAPAIFSI